MIGKYGDDKSGFLSLHIDKLKIQKEKNILVPFVLNRSKAYPSGLLSEKYLMEINCDEKKLAQVMWGGYIGPMGTGEPVTDKFGPLKYGPVPFKEWMSIRESSPAYLKDMIGAVCSAA